MKPKSAHKPKPAAPQIFRISIESGLACYSPETAYADEWLIQAASLTDALTKFESKKPNQRKLLIENLGTLRIR